jgi:hypothetical protein
VGVHGDDMEIASGVVAGDRVAIKGAGFLKDGDKVAVAMPEGGPQAAITQQAAR